MSLFSLLIRFVGLSLRFSVSSSSFTETQMLEATIFSRPKYPFSTTFELYEVGERCFGRKTSRRQVSDVIASIFARAGAEIFLNFIRTYPYTWQRGN